MEVETQVNEQDDEHSEFKKIANDVQLPSQIVECLLNSGFDSVSAVADLVDIKAIETFLRENFFLFENSPARFKMYGMYCSFPEKFSFLPGHVPRLNKFIEECKRVSKKQASFKKNLKSAFDSVNKSAYSLYDVSDHVSSGDADGKDPMNGSPSKSFTARDSSDASEVELMIYDDITRKLKAWCSNHANPKVRSLQFEQDYKIKIARKTVSVELQDFENNPESAAAAAYVLRDKFQLVVSLVCCICARCIRLQLRKKTYLISNASRHLAKCAGKLKEDKKGPASVFILLPCTDINKTPSITEITHAVQNANFQGETVIPEQSCTTNEDLGNVSILP